MADDGMGFQIASAYVQISARTTGLREQVAAQIAAAVEGQEIGVRLQSNADGLREQVAAQAKEAAAGNDIKTRMTVDDSHAREQVREDIEEIQRDSHVEIKIDTTEAETALAELAAEIEAVKAEASSFESEFRRAMGEADRISESAANDMRGSFSVVENGSRTLRQAVSAIPDLLKDTENSGRSLSGSMSELSNKMNSAFDAAMGGAGKVTGVVGPMQVMLGAAIALAPALAALPAAIGAFAGGLGVAAVAMKGVIAAMGAADQASAGAGQSAAQLAQQAFSNALQIQQAEQAITNAKRQAADAAISAANSMISANQQVANSEYALMQATQSLADAKANAQNQIDDANNSAKDAALGVTSAQLAAEQAQQQYNATMQNSLATPLMKKQAAQALAEAEQRVADAQQRSKEATQAANKANQEGVDGLPSVVSAEHSYEQAVQGVENAQRNLANTARTTAEQQQQAIQAVQQAEQNLTNTYKQQQLAAAAAASAGGGANAFNQAMSKLTPVGREVVNTLLEMKQGMSGVAQNAFLPGFLKMLQDLQPVMPQVRTAMMEMGNAVGGLASGFGALFQNKQFVSEFFRVFQEGAQFVSTVGSGLGQMFQLITQAASSAGPIIQALGSGLSDVLVGVGNLFVGLSSGGQGAAQSIQAVLGFIGDLLGPLGELVGAVSSALGPALDALRPILDTLIKQFVSAILPMLPSLSKALLAVVQVFGSLLQILEPIMPILSQALIGALQILGPLLQGLARFLADNAGWLKYVAEGLLALAFPMESVVVGVLYMWDHFKGFRDFVSGMLTDFHNWFFDIWHFIDDVWHGIQDATNTSWQLIKKYLINPIDEAYHFVIDKFDSIKDTVKRLPGDLAALGVHMWDWVYNTFKGAINIVIGWWDDLNFTTPRIHIPGTPSSWDIGPYTIGLPHIDKLADGGTIREGGDVIVGDRGIERLTLPPGAVVEPLKHNPSGRPSGGGDTITVQSLNVSINARMFPDFSRPNALDANAKLIARQIRDALAQVQRDNS